MHQEEEEEGKTNVPWALTAVQLRSKSNSPSSSKSTRESSAAQTVRRAVDSSQQHHTTDYSPPVGRSFLQLQKGLLQLLAFGRRFDVHFMSADFLFSHETDFLILSSISVWLIIPTTTFEKIYISVSLSISQLFMLTLFVWQQRSWQLNIYIILTFENRKYLSTTLGIRWDIFGILFTSLPI